MLETADACTGSRLDEEVTSGSDKNFNEAANLLGRLHLTSEEFNRIDRNMPPRGGEYWLGDPQIRGHFKAHLHHRGLFQKKITFNRTFWSGVHLHL